MSSDGRPRALWLLTAGLSTAGLLAGCGLLGETPTATSPSGGVTASGPAEPAPAQVARRVGAPVPEPPAAMTLPDGHELRVRAVSATANGVLDVPIDIDQAGWWRGGSRIGDPFGSTLIAAHVDSVAQGLGPFATILQVRPGARVHLRSKHLEQTFVVTSLRLIPRASFAHRPALLSSRGPRRLVLVTCAGPYDPARGGYQSLAVVSAMPASEPKRREA